MFDRMRSSSLVIVLSVMVGVSVTVTLAVTTLHGIYSTIEDAEAEIATDPYGPGSVSYNTGSDWPEIFTPSVSLIELALRSTADNHVDEGDYAIVPGFKWVAVQNDKVIESGNNEFTFGDVCSVFQGVPIEAVSFSRDGKVLVEYKRPGIAYGAPCEGGVRFLIDPDDFIRLNQLYMMLRNGEVGARELVDLELREIDLG
ncbi:MAG: hypothetical protein AAB690_00210 [Patescibacteria group bacterium]